MAYVRGARRHPSMILTITPEMEAQIERDIAGPPQPKVKATPKERGMKRPRALRSDAQPCGTPAAYARHIRKGETPCYPCSIAGRANKAAYRAARRKPRKRPLQPCGTHAAYRRHIERGEEVDDACKEANRVRSARQYADRMARRNSQENAA